MKKSHFDQALSIKDLSERLTIKMLIFYIVIEQAVRFL